MATPTPGILLRLLQAMNSPTAPRVTGDHRSPLLQVVGIVPALSHSIEDDLGPNRGFYVNLSDSQNSTYVSLPDSDTDLILSNRLQLGQFVHLDRLLFLSPPVPTAIGVRPTAGRHPFLGSPEPLITRVSSNRSFVIQPVSDSEYSVDPIAVYLSNRKPNDCAAVSTDCHSKSSSARKPLAPLDDNNESNISSTRIPKRFSSPGTGSKRSVSAKRRDNSSCGEVESSPVVGDKGSRRSASPVPSKCVVPSLVAAKEENRKSAREPAIVVPSRYRQPSPTGRRASSVSPGRRLSIGTGMKLASPAIAGEKTKKMASIMAGIAKVSEAIGKNGRKGWDETPTKEDLKEKASGLSKRKPNVQSLLKTQAALSRRLSDANSINCNDAEDTCSEKSKTDSTEEASTERSKTTPTSLGFTMHDKKWTDGSVPLESLSSDLACLGKGAMEWRVLASTAAAEALEEAIAIESIVRSISIFAELCAASKTGNPLPIIDRFFSVYEDAVKHTRKAESVAVSRCSDHSSAITEQSKSATLWIEAALATDLEIVSLVNNLTSDPPTSLPKSLSKRRSVKAKSSSLVQDPVNGVWTKGHKMKETAALGKRLLSEMQLWFVMFIEESLDAGFKVLGDCKANGNLRLPLAAILSMLKRVNDWLDLVLSGEDFLSKKVDSLKKKIYEFLMQHVGSNFDDSSDV